MIGYILSYWGFVVDMMCQYPELVITPVSPSGIASSGLGSALHRWRRTHRTCGKKWGISPTQNGYLHGENDVENEHDD
jgi:hypothetical protein